MRDWKRSHTHHRSRYLADVYGYRRAVQTDDAGAIVSKGQHRAERGDRDITVVVAHIPTRTALLQKALKSIDRQILKPASVIVIADPEHRGAAATKNEGLAAVRTPWVAFLDDDDQMLPTHLYTLRAAARDTAADVVYSVPLIPENPGFVFSEPQYFQPFDADVLRQRSYIQTTSLVRTELMREAGGFQCPPGSDYDDWGAWLAMLDRGAKFHHVPEQTFVWHHWGYGQPGNPGNTSGRGDRW